MKGNNFIRIEANSWKEKVKEACQGWNTMLDVSDQERGLLSQAHDLSLEDPRLSSPMLKIVIVGLSGSGKSCIAKRLCSDRFEETTQTTGIRFYNLGVRMEREV